MADLIEELKTFDPEDRVVFTCDYGNISHTQQAFPIQSIDEVREYQRIEETAYSRSGIALVEFNEEEHDNEEWERGMDDADSVVVLS